MKFPPLLIGLFCVAMFSQCNKTPDLNFSEIEYLDGEQTKSVEVGNGKKTVIHFYASWCGDCRREMPDANKILADAPEDIRVYYLTDDPPERRLGMEKKYAIPFPTYQLKGSLKSAGAYYIPLTYFIDKTGKQVIAQAEQINWQSNEIKTFLGY